MEDIKKTLKKVRMEVSDYQHNAVLSVLRMNFDMFYRKGWTKMDLMAKDCEVRDIAWKTEHHREIYPDEEERLLVAAKADPQFYTMLRFLFAFSPRRNELLGLTWGDVETKRGKLYLGGSLVCEKDVREKGLSKSPDSERMLPMLSEDIISVIKAHRGRSVELGHSIEPDAPLFPNQLGNFITPVKFNKKFREFRELAGLPKDVVPHGARGALASRAHRRGTPVNTIRAWLGHSDLKTTMKYLTVNDDDLRKMAKIVQDLGEGA